MKNVNMIIKINLLVVVLVIFSSFSLFGGSKSHNVKPGIDVFLEANKEDLSGKKVGIFFNDKALSLSGKYAFEELSAKKYEPSVIIFPVEGISPETAGILEKKAAAKCPKASLVKLDRNNLKIDKKIMEQIDILFVDIQLNGTSDDPANSMLARLLEQSKERGCRVIILDRPDPFGGVFTTGCVSDKQSANQWDNYLPLKSFHAMTTAELASFYNSYYGIQMEITNYLMENWKRSMTFVETGIPIKINKNDRELNESGIFSMSREQVGNYYFLKPLYAAGMSLAEGTKERYQVFGSPDINSEQLLNRLASYDTLEGCSFSETEFTPKEGALKGKACKGIRIDIFPVNGKVVDPLAVMVKLIRTLTAFDPVKYSSSVFYPGIKNRQILDMIYVSGNIEETLTQIRINSSGFDNSRAKSLMYEDENENK